MTRAITYNVRVYKITTLPGKKRNTYRVRWKVEEKIHAEIFPRKAQAESYHGELQTATRKGEAFSLDTGKPVSWGRVKQAEVSWYDFACMYVDMKWKNVSGKYRENIARAMVAATPPMIYGNPPATEKELRSALHNWGFNTKRRHDAPDAIAERLRWLSTSTRPLRDLAIPTVAREVLEAATSKLDGTRAAPDTVRKHRMLLNNAMDYAIELGLLDSNPIKAIKWTAPTRTTMREVDRRCVVNHQRAKTLLKAVREQEPSGPRLVAFFALMYYAALRPEEVVNIRRHDLTLPAESETDGWGELHLSGAAPHVGRNWTDDNALREERQLKHRDQGETRPVPVSPDLVKILRKHLADFHDGRAGRLFYGVRADELPVTTYMGAWRAARKEALTEQEHASPLARRPYDLRHACVSTWLNAGVPAPQVAEWAGHSVDVLLTIYAKCIEGQDSIAKKRIAAALSERE